jgi:hypothetical protein
MWKFRIWLMVLRCLFDMAVGKHTRWVAGAKASRARLRERTPLSPAEPI